ncbi:MAG: NmrA/HSCARG family protein [Polyangiaceae bacterium]|nr:NmrA/HSCARG family protein [Polyangiaceae bacterium]
MFNEDMPLITIVGATSKQGRSAAHTLLASGRYRVRALTRNVDSPEARSLAAKGAELCKVPLELGRTRALVEAFRGSHGAFLMTPPISPPATHETELGKQQADAAVEAGVQHVVYSALENVDVITSGKKFAPHFTDKARVEEYIRGLPVQSSFVYLAYFYTNLIEFYRPRMEGDTLVFPIYLPGDYRAPFVDPLTATGPAVLEIFSNPTRYAGMSLPVVGDIISPIEMVETFQRVTGKKAAYRSAYQRDELLRYFPSFGENELFVRELLGMVEYTVEHGYFQPHRDLEWSRKVDPVALTWEGFLRKTNWRGEAMSFGVAA